MVATNEGHKLVVPKVASMVDKQDERLLLLCLNTLSYPGITSVYYVHSSIDYSFCKT